LRTNARDNIHAMALAHLAHLGSFTCARFSDILMRFTSRLKAVEKRGVKHHRGRLGEALREEIETLVEGELGDPRIGLVSVTGVQLAEDGRSAQVLVDVEGDDDEAERSLEGLDAAKAYIRHELADRLRLRRAPELFFRLDCAERESARIEELIARAKKRSKTHKNPTGEASGQKA
jgi:ribosome-binding factor A